MARLILTNPFPLLRQHILYKAIFTVIILIMIITVSLWMSDPDSSSGKKCFRRNYNFANVGEVAITLLEDIMESEKKPTPGKTIFFHETSCSKNGLVRLNAR